jgi:hypothetical protein
MQGCKLTVVPYFRLQALENLSKRDEGCVLLVDVFSVDLIGNYHYAIFSCKLKNLGYYFFVEYGTCRVARIYDYNCFDILPLLF